MTGFVASPIRTVEIEQIAPKMLEAAFAVTAGRMQLPSAAQAFCKLAAGDAAATTYFRHELARQIAMLLLMVDQNVLAVYDEQEAVVEEIGADTPHVFAPLRLLVRVRWETATLRPVLDDINAALCQALYESMGRPVTCFANAVVLADSEAWILDGRHSLHRPGPELLAARDDMPAELR
jgi:hypothetical protein